MIHTIKMSEVVAKLQEIVDQEDDAWKQHHAKKSEISAIT